MDYKRYSANITVTINIHAESPKSAKSVIDSMKSIFKDVSISGAGFVDSANIESYDGQVGKITIGKLREVTKINAK